MFTARELADRVRDIRREAWSKSDPTATVMMVDRLDSEDVVAVRRVVAGAGYTGEKYEPMVRHVADLLVGLVAALDDDLPATGSD